MGIKFVGIGLLLSLIGVSNGKLFRSDYFYNQKVGGWLKHHPFPAKWEEAVLTCHREGAVLASPLDEDFRTALTDIMVDLNMSSMFTGISNIYSSTEFQSMEGVPLSNMCFTWSVIPDPVTLAATTTCFTLNTNGSMAAASCSDPQYFACYRKEGVKLNECGPVDAGFKFYNKTGSCYKLVNELAVWSDAFKNCARQGAHLAIINSETEAEVLRELAKNLLARTPAAPKNQTFILIGFRAWGDNPRIWITIQGQSLSEAGYAKWAQNEPNLPAERCGSFYQLSNQGILNNIYCSRELKYICEIDPEA